MNEQELGDDQMYFLDGVGAIDQSKIAFTEIRQVEKKEFPTGANREQRRRLRRVARKRGRGFTT